MTVEAMEQDLKVALSRHEEQEAPALFALKERRTSEDVEKAMTMLFGPVSGPDASRQLAGADWKA